MYFNLFSIIFVIALAVYINLKIKDGERGRNVPLQKLLDDEREANSVRKKEIGDEYFFVADEQRLKFGVFLETDEHFSDNLIYEKEVKKYLNKTMICFKSYISNIDIKRTFGAPNFEVVVEYEDNFNKFVTALKKWAIYLDSINEEEKAQTLKDYLEEIEPKNA